MKQIFISDLHLDPGQERLTAGFFKFITTICADADELYILGDFFEVWLGDDDVNPFNQSIIDAVAALTADTYIMHGNRDFLIGDTFCEAANVTMLDDPTRLELAAGPVLLMHGDSLCTRDDKYMLARKQLRSAAFKADVLAKSLAERAAIAQNIRGESKELTRETAADIMDVTPEEVVKVMQDAGVNVLIHGHTHRPAVHELNLAGGPARRYVLGDWQTSTQYLEILDGEIKVEQYDF